MSWENIHTKLQSRCWENRKYLRATFCHNLVTHQSNRCVQCRQLIVVERTCLSFCVTTYIGRYYYRLLHRSSSTVQLNSHNKIHNTQCTIITLINHCTCWQRHSYQTCAVAEAAVTDSIRQLRISCRPSQLPKVARATSLLVLIRRFQMSGTYFVNIFYRYAIARFSQNNSDYYYY